MVNSLTMKSLGEVIRERRLKLGLSQRKLAELSRVSRTYINLLEKGKRKGSKVSSQKIIAIARALQISAEVLLEIAAGVIPQSVDRLVDGLLDDYRAIRDSAKIPRYGFVPAGSLFPAEQEHLGEVEIPRGQLEAAHDVGELYALRVAGSSLLGDGIEDGSDIIIDRNALEIIDGKIYVIRLGSEVCTRHVYKANDHLRLVSSNGEHREILATKVEILGRVILSGRWKRH